MNNRRPGKMTCPICGSPTDVYDTQRDVHGGIRRRRRCENNHRFNTYEGRIGQVWDLNRRVVPVDEDDYDAEVLAARLNLEAGGVDEM